MPVPGGAAISLAYFSLAYFSLAYFSLEYFANPLRASRFKVFVYEKIAELSWFSLKWRGDRLR